MPYSILRLSDHPGWIPAAADWFSEKWGISASVYRESMESATAEKAIPQWYIAVEDGVDKGNTQIVGGLGVIANDFHPRVDLTPNVCAVYTEAAHRCCGIAGALLDTVCRDLHKYGVDTVYLLTDHTAFYERYGWEYLCPVTANGEDRPARMYIHRYAEE